MVDHNSEISRAEIFAKSFVDTLLHAFLKKWAPRQD